MARPRIAAIVTEYRQDSHADVIVGKMLAGYDLDGVWTEPGVEVVSLYTDQVPANDLSRGLAAKFGVPIFGTVRDALTLAGRRLAVDSVVLIGEHGDYPRNALDQTLYPRRRLFAEILAVFEASGRVVPLFTDKHFSYDWASARWMFDSAVSLGVPLMAGSSLPVTWRVPPLEIAHGTPLDEALVVGYGPTESYGFHALEALQCFVERRSGGEVGLGSVECVEGAGVWALAGTAWDERLLRDALAACAAPQPGDPAANCPAPVLFRLHYRDGLRAAVLLLNGHLKEFAFATRTRDGQVLATGVRLQSERPYGHFARLVRTMEPFLAGGEEPYPPQRTLLTTGALALLMQSRYRGQPLQTPELAIAYQAADWPRRPVPTGAAVLPLGW